MTDIFDPLPPVPREPCGLCGKATRTVRRLTASEEKNPDADRKWTVTNAVTVQEKRLVDYHNTNDAEYGGEEGTIETFTLDLCPTCFETKLVPWFESEGGTPRKDQGVA